MCFNTPWNVIPSFGVLKSPIDVELGWGLMTVKAKMTPNTYIKFMFCYLFVTHLCILEGTSGITKSVYGNTHQKVKKKF